MKTYIKLILIGVAAASLSACAGTDYYSSDYDTYSTDQTYSDPPPVYIHDGDRPTYSWHHWHRRHYDPPIYIHDGHRHRHFGPPSGGGSHAHVGPPSGGGSHAHVGPPSGGGSHAHVGPPSGGGSHAHVGPPSGGGSHSDVGPPSDDGSTIAHFDRPSSSPSISIH